MIITGYARSGRVTAALLASVATAGLVAGCAGSGGSKAAGSSAAGSPAASSSESGPRQSPLSKGLLPAGAFGSQANVVSMTAQQLKQATGGQLGATNGMQVDPPQCGSALQSTQPDVDKVKDFVAESATAAGSITVEAIMTGDSVKNAVQGMKTGMSACPTITVTSPQGGTATLTFAPVDVSGVGTQAAATQFTTTVARPSQPPVTLPALIGLAQDGDRLVLLVSAAAPGAGGAAPAQAPDQATFTSLLKQAYTTEKKALD